MKKRILSEWKILSIIVVFFAIGIMVMLVPKGANWDGAVYVGMGKFLFSHGHVGTWELLRPVGLSVLLGLFWKIGLDPYAAGSVLVLISGALLLYAVYRFGEKIRSGTGMVAALLLLVTPLFIQYSIFPTTDLISTFISFCALLIFVNATRMQNFFWAGVVAGIAFLFRFPQGLIVLITGTCLLAETFVQSEKRFHFFWSRAWRYGIGFLTLIAPFLICNKIAYGNAFLPLIAGNAVIAQYSHLYFKGTWFYFKGLFENNIFFVAAIIPFVALWRRKFRSRALVATTIALIILAGYFLYQPHKELRYSIAFLPYVALLSGYGITILFDVFHIPKMIFPLVLIVGIFCFERTTLFRITHMQKPITPFETFFEAHPTGRILSSNAYPLAQSDVLLVRSLYYDWNDAYLAYELHKNNINYIALDSCDLETSCPENETCMDKKELLLSTLAKEGSLALQTHDGSCQEWIYTLD